MGERQNFSIYKKVGIKLNKNNKYQNQIEQK